MPTYQQLIGNLVESGDPPVSSRTTSLAPPVGPARTKHIWHMVVLTIIFLIIPAALFFYFHHWIFGGILALLGVAMVRQSFVTDDVWVAACPYCSAVFEPSQRLRPDNEGKVVQCKACFEYSIYSEGRVRAHDPNSISEVPSFVSPVFEGGVWPNGCVACGAPPTRLDEVKTRKVSYGMLAFGRVWVTSGKTSGIPYCEAHRAAVDLKMDQAQRLTLVWCSLRMMRRYVALNRQLGRKPAGRKWI
jgi:hypothetical protein